MTNSIPIQFIQKKESWTSFISYQFRIETPAAKTDAEMDKLAQVFDETFDPYRILCFFQFGETFVEGFFDAVNAEYSDAQYLQFIEAAMKKVPFELSSAVLTKTIPL